MTTNETQQRLRPLILEAMDTKGGYETAKGWLRYEKMRTLNLGQLAELHTRNLKGERLDDMIDQLLTETK